MNISREEYKTASGVPAGNEPEQTKKTEADGIKSENPPADETGEKEYIKEPAGTQENADINSGADEADGESTAGGHPDDKKSLRACKAEIKKLKEENKNFSTSFAELEDRYLRMIAEYDNFRRRSAKERESAYTDAYADALKEILPVIDNLERALTFADAGSAKDDKLTEGVVMTLNQFTEALGHMGVVTVGAKGEPFNPEFHNAVMHEEDETKGVNEIDEVFQKGYKRDEKVIRYAMVKVVN